MSKRLRVSIFRCQEAYAHYLNGREYYKALRIFRANEILYSDLQKYLYENEDHLEHTVKFIFHLEDWFAQFTNLENELGEHLNLSSKFVFTRFDDSPEFPKNFLEKLT